MTEVQPDTMQIRNAKQCRSPPFSRLFLYLGNMLQRHQMSSEHQISPKDTLLFSGFHFIQMQPENRLQDHRVCLLQILSVFYFCLQMKQPMTTHTKYLTQFPQTRKKKTNVKRSLCLVKWSSWVALVIKVSCFSLWPLIRQRKAEAQNVVHAENHF